MTARDPYGRLAFCRALRRLRFVRYGRDDDPIVYGKQLGDRLLDVQLWKDGRHRASHMLAGRGSTDPTPFATLDGLYQAIIREATRTDHAPHGTVADIPDAELLRRAVERCIPHRGRPGNAHPRWAAVMDNFVLGSGYAQQLCRRFGIDPDMTVKR